MSVLEGQETIILEAQQTLELRSKPFRSCIACLAAFRTYELFAPLFQPRSPLSSTTLTQIVGATEFTLQTTQANIQTLQAGKFLVLPSPCLGCRCLTSKFHPVKHVRTTVVPLPLICLIILSLSLLLLLLQL